jgi:hypothetical protein
MIRTVSGFTLFEVLLYLGIFSIMSFGLLAFHWNISDLGVKENVSRQASSDARFIASRLETLIRESASVDGGSSVFDDANGQIVLGQPGSSDTVTVSVVSGRVTLMGTSIDPVALHSSATEASELRFEHRGSASDGSEYVGFVLSIRSVQSGHTRAPYNASSTIRSGAFLRNQNL